MLPLVNIIEAVSAEIRSRGYQRVALFGTRYVVESSMLQHVDGVEVVVPEQIEAIHSAYMQVVEGQGRRVGTPFRKSPANCRWMQ